MSFELVSGPDNHTQIIEHTVHELRLDPILYWLPIARWAIAEKDKRSGMERIYVSTDGGGLYIASMILNCGDFYFLLGSSAGLM